MPSSKGRYLGEGIIELPPGASTLSRLHEFAHRRMGHEPGDMPIREFVDKEIDAERWAWEAMDKKPTHRIGIPAVLPLIEDYNFSIQEAVHLVVERLRMKGIPVTRSGGEDLTRLALGGFR